MPQIPPTLRSLAVPVESLKPYSRNPRRGDLDRLTASLNRHGQYRPIVVNARTQEVLAGNHTLRAAQQLGWAEIAATFVDVDDDTAARIVLVDNRTNDVAGYDDQALAELLQDLPDLDGTGYDAGDLDALLGSLTPLEPTTSGDTDPAGLPPEPRTVPGDLYRLGDHRLLCGSSTDATAVERLLAGAPVDMIVTDPPYGVDYEADGGSELSAATRAALHRSRRRPSSAIANDVLGEDGTRQLIADAFSISGLKPGGAFYVCAPSGDMLSVFLRALVEAGLPMRHGLVWVKDVFAFGRSDYHYRHELILYGWRDGAAHYFVEDRTQDSVWEIPRPRASEEHPTMKPVELFERAITNSSRPGEVVYDLFAGSGTALIACENQGRRARLMELDRAYCDVIVDRWERHTGLTAELIHAEAPEEAAAPAAAT